MSENPRSRILNAIANIAFLAVLVGCFLASIGLVAIGLPWALLAWGVGLMVGGAIVLLYVSRDS